jgi:DNA repair exonuclease SbcCD ATPase subunit
MLADTTTSQLFDFLPQIALIVAISVLIGWSLKGHFTKAKPAKAAAPAENPNRDRAKNLEAALDKSKTAHKSLKSELETLQAASVPTATLEKTSSELEAARKALETESKRIATLETDLKKAQDTIKNLNGRANEADKAQKDRSFTLENELSQARQQLAQLEAQPDDSAVLHAEIERLRESVAVSSRFAGEVRKRESVAVEALQKAQAELAAMGDSSRAVPKVSKKVGPVGDSDRVAAAKAEVLRLVEKNKQATAVPAEETVLPAAEEPVAAEEQAVVVMEKPAMVIEEPVPAIIEEEIPVTIGQESIATTKKTATGDLFAMD